MRRVRYCTILLLVAVLGILLVGCNFVEVDSTPLHFVVDGEAYCDLDVTAFRDKGLAMPEKEGYRFDGWYADMACTQSIRPAGCRAETTIYGRYVKVQQPLPSYTVRFCYEDGTLYYTTTATSLATIVYPDPPEKEGYEFSGWRGMPDALVDDIVLLATFRPVYTVVFLAEDDTVVQQTTETAGAYVLPPDPPAKVADDYNTYRFAGWVCEQGDYVNVQGDVVARVQYAAVPKQYRYVFHPNNGQADIEGTDGYDASIRVPTVSKDRQGAYTYRFAGWDTDGDGVADQVGRTIRLQGNWEAWALYDEQLVLCTVRFWVDDTLIYSVEVPYGQGVAYTQTPTKAPDAQYTYNFTGWDATFQTVEQDMDIHALFEDRTLNLYTYRFVDGDKVYAEGKDLPYGTLIAAPAESATREGSVSTVYVFDGWTGYTEGMALQQDCVFEAAFHSETPTYKIAFFDAMSGDEVQYSLPYDALIVPPPFPDDDNYAYQWLGWTEGDKVSRDRTYRLGRTPRYTVIWHLDADTVYTTTKVTQGEVALPPADPEREGFRFDGWGDLTAPIEADSDCWAQWTPLEQ